MNILIICFAIQDPSLLCTYFAPCIACALRGTLDDCMSTCLSHLNYTVVPEALIDSGGFIYDVLSV